VIVFDAVRSRAPAGAPGYCISVRERTRPKVHETLEWSEAMRWMGRLTGSAMLTLAADWLFQDVSINTKSDNQLGMLTLGLTFF
jgi:hypothetical protein